MNEAGRLYVPNANSIIRSLWSVVKSAIKTGTPIISTMDYHEQDDEEFKTYPPHCVANSLGVNKIAYTIPFIPMYTSTVALGEEVSQETLENNMQFLVHKKTYNVWDESLGNPNAMKAILSHFKPDNIFLCGVATDVCVVAAAKGLSRWVYDNGWKTKMWLIKDAIMGLNIDSEVKAQGDMINLGFVRVSSSQLTGMM
jgi:nicotinamidase/pyrazinamidase